MIVINKQNKYKQRIKSWLKFLGSVMNTIYIDTATTIKIFIWKLRHNLFGRRE